MKNRIIKILIIVVTLLLCLCSFFGVYLSNYNDGDERAYEVINNPSKSVKVESSEEGIAFIPKGNYDTGIVFYPGAKVTASAYAPMADSLAAKGYLCVIMNMPFHLALLDQDCALDEMEEWPAVQNWYIGGHSMGGLAAEHCALDHSDEFAGLILLGSRIRSDFSGSDLPVLTIYATNDDICSVERVEASDLPEPKNYTTVMIQGGCHRYFGSYEKQAMDGTPTISWKSQQKQILKAMNQFMNPKAGGRNEHRTDQ